MVLTYLEKSKTIRENIVNRGKDFLFYGMELKNLILKINLVLYWISWVLKYLVLTLVCLILHCLKLSAGFGVWIIYLALLSTVGLEIFNSDGFYIETSKRQNGTFSASRYFKQSVLIDWLNISMSQRHVQCRLNIIL